MLKRSFVGSLVGMSLVFGCGGDTPMAFVEDSTGSSSAASTTTIVPTTSGETTASGEDTVAVATMMDESTTEESLCGNGVLDPGEECDDGNDEWLDECRPDCTRSFEVLWTHSYDGSANFFDSYAGVAVDPAGMIYVVGWHVLEGTRRELLVKQYTPDGLEGWTFSYRGDGDGHDFGHGIARLPGGDLVVCGSTTTIEHGDDFLVMRLTPETDEPVWVQTYSGSSEGETTETCRGIAVDDIGNLVTIGHERSESLTWDITLRKYDADGELSWSHGYGDPFGGNDFGFQVAVDGEGNIMALGRVQEVQSLDRTWVRSYSADGDERWTYRSGSDGSPNWFAFGLAVDGHGDTLLTGLRASNAVLAKLDGGGEEVWRSEVESGTSGNAVAIGPTGDMIVAGEVRIPSAGRDIWAAGFDDRGQPRWGFTYGDEIAKLDDVAGGVAVDTAGDVIVVGFETVLGQQTNGWIRKIRPAT